MMNVISGTTLTLDIVILGSLIPKGVRSPSLIRNSGVVRDLSFH